MVPSAKIVCKFSIFFIELLTGSPESPGSPLIPSPPGGPTGPGIPVNPIGPSDPLIDDC